MNNLTPEQTARYESLKATGFIRLKADEKAEYQALVGLIKGALVGGPVSLPQQVSSPIAKEETVTVTKTAFDEILSRLNTLESQKSKAVDVSLGVNSVWEEVDTKPKVFIATMKTYRDKYLVDWRVDRKQWSERLQTMEDIMEVTLLTDGENEKLEITTSEFAKLPRKEVKILDIEAQKLRKVIGKVRSNHQDYDNFGKFSRQGDWIDQDVKALKRVFKVQLEDGRNLTVDERILNS